MQLFFILMTERTHFTCISKLVRLSWLSSLSALKTLNLASSADLSIHRIPYLNDSFPPSAEPLVADFLCCLLSLNFVKAASRIDTLARSKDNKSKMRHSVWREWTNFHSIFTRTFIGWYKYNKSFYYLCIKQWKE